MPSLIINNDTVTVRLQSQHLELVKRADSGMANDFARIRVPLFDVERVMVVGRPSVSVAVLQKFMFEGIPVSFLTARGRWIGALCTDNNMNAGRRIRQYEVYRDEQLKLKLASRIVFAKIRNSRRVLQRLAANRKESDDPRQVKVCEILKRLARFVLLRAENLDQLRGFEGMAAAAYFSRLGAFFPENIPFRERSRRPPANAANSILSWTYTIVQGEIDAVIRSHGLDPCIGFLHSVEHGTPSLTLDLLEPLRAPLCDMLSLHLLNHRILREEHFEFNTEDGGTYLKADARKEFFFAYENAMIRKFALKPGGNHVDFRKIIEDSVLTVLKAMENDDDYEFFLMP
eukprot:TRINITY_DN1607_c0_g1_i1.p1 TRINITY_DN1607_c0_g1~~TRINITY_DN1607_c0_g1_i1.p1  ORF type:complete len:344 (-),score=74.00 TRINITY_DN1607_c0_g1_i1:615-1646(-)